MSKLTINDITSGYFSTSALNAAFTAIETAIENTVSRDGTTPNQMTADLDMNSNRVTNLAEPTNLNDAARLQDVQDAIAGDTAANLISFTPYSTITSTTVQGAIQEVVDETVASLATKQPLDTTLTALAGTLTAANKIPYATALDTAGELDFKDEDNMISDSATAIPSQQSVKAYADTKNIATQVVPTTTGNVLFTTNGTTWSSTPKITSGTAIATTSGTSHDFTGIPSWVKRITLSVYNLSTSGISPLRIQLGDSGGLENTGYLGAALSFGASSVATTNFSAGFDFPALAATYMLQGVITFTLLDATTNTWVTSGFLGRSEGTGALQLAGSKPLSATLTQLRVTTVGGTDTFDSGLINITYE